MIRQRLLWLSCVLGNLFLGSLAFAHEGHGHAGEGNSAKHYVTEPVHVLQFGLVAAVVLACGWMAMRWFSSKHTHQSHPIARDD